MTSSTPAPIGWPVKPLVLQTTISSAAAPNVLRRGEDLGRSTAASEAGVVRFVRDKGQLRGHAITVDAKAALGAGHQAVHSLTDVTDVQACAVESTVGRFAAQQLDDTAHAALAYRIFAFDDKGTGAHAKQRTMAAAVKGQRSFIHLVVDGGRASGPGTLRQPSPSGYRRLRRLHRVRFTRRQRPLRIPVLSQGNALGGAGTGGVDVCIWATCADVLGELAVAHSQNAEDKAAVELVGCAYQFVLRSTTVVRLSAGSTSSLDILAQFLEHDNLLAQVFQA